eukprot:2290707-Pyramimonas_sp.AAC.1
MDRHEVRKEKKGGSMGSPRFLGHPESSSGFLNVPLEFPESLKNSQDISKLRKMLKIPGQSSRFRGVHPDPGKFIKTPLGSSSLRVLQGSSELS